MTTIAPLITGILHVFSDIVPFGWMETRRFLQNEFEFMRSKISK